MNHLKFILQGNLPYLVNCESIEGSKCDHSISKLLVNPTVTCLQLELYTIYISIE